MIQDKDLPQKEERENPHSKVNIQGMKEYNLMLREMSVTVLLSTRGLYLFMTFRGAAMVCLVETEPK